MVGDKVCLTEGYAAYGDAARGPLSPGDQGIVRHAVHDPPMVEVVFMGKTWSYLALAVTTAMTAGTVPGAVVTSANFRVGARVVRGPAWSGGDEDGGVGGHGMLAGTTVDGARVLATVVWKVGGGERRAQYCISVGAMLAFASVPHRRPVGTLATHSHVHAHTGTHTRAHRYIDTHTCRTYRVCLLQT